MSPRSSASPDWLVFAVKQLGPGVLIAAVFAWFLIRVYDDLNRRNEAFVELMREEIRTSQAVAASLEKLSDKIDASRLTTQNQ